MLADAGWEYDHAKAERLRAQALGCEFMATGHYVRRVPGPGGPELHRALDPARDQSYFLYATTEQQLAFLRRHGCDEAQGFGLVRPLPPGEITRLLGEGRRWSFLGTPPPRRRTT